MPRKVGKPAFKPTDEERALVEQMTAVGIPQESICLVVRDGIDDKTLRKHFRWELDTAKIKANAKIGAGLFNKAMKGDVAALIFWAKTQMGWKETNINEHTGKDGGPIELKTFADVARASVIPLGEPANDQGQRPRKQRKRA